MKRCLQRTQASGAHAVLIAALFAITLTAQHSAARQLEDVYDRVKHGYADSGGVKIHYAMIGPRPQAPRWLL